MEEAFWVAENFSGSISASTNYLSYAGDGEPELSGSDPDLKWSDGVRQYDKQARLIRETVGGLSTQAYAIIDVTVYYDESKKKTISLSSKRLL